MPSAWQPGWPPWADLSGLTGAPFRQFLIAAISTVRPAMVEAPLCRLTCAPRPTSIVGPFTALAQESRREDVNVAVHRAITRCRAAGAQLRVDTAHYVPGRDPGQQATNAEPLVSYTIQWEGTCDRQPLTAQGALLELRHAVDRFSQPTRWATCAALDDLAGAVIFPASRHSICAIAAHWQQAAARFGGRVFATSTGIAMTGAPPAVAQTWIDEHAHRTPAYHSPMRILAYDPGDGAPREGSRSTTPAVQRWDFWLTTPSAGHDLLWLVHSVGQHSLADVGHALFTVLGEATANSAVRAWHPRRQRSSDMIQVSVPAHLRRRMQLGPGADGQIRVGGRELPVFPFTYYPDTALGRPLGVNFAAQDVDEVARRAPTDASRTAMAGPGSH